MGFDKQFDKHLQATSFFVRLICKQQKSVMTSQKVIAGL
eukprot:SAG31_NODE_28830_length_404_cov_1.498361_2_plen_38_part_01